VARQHVGRTGDLAILLNNAGEIQREGGDATAAEGYYREAISIWTELGGIDAPQLAAPLNNLGLLKTGKGHFEEAEKCLQRALDLDRRKYGDDHPECATGRHNLGELYESMGRVEEACSAYAAAAKAYAAAGVPAFARSLGRALMLLLRAGRAQEAAALLAAAQPALSAFLDGGEVDSPEHLDDIGWVASRVGLYPLSKRLHERSLALRTSRHGQDAPECAISLNCLGSCIQKMGDGVAAEALYRRALSTADDGYRLHVLNNLSNLLLGQGRVEEAASGFEHLLAEHERRASTGVELGRTLNALGEVRRAQARYAEAEALGTQALRIRRAALGDRHPDVAETLSNLALLYRDLGDTDRAARHAEEGLAVLEATVGQEHPMFSTLLANLALIRLTSGDHASAEPLYRLAAALVAARDGEDHPDFAVLLSQLGLLYESMLDFGKAEVFFHRSMDIKAAALNATHPSLLRSGFHLANLYVEMGRAKDALEVARRLSASVSASNDVDPRTRAMALGLLGSALHSAGELDAAESTLLRALEEKRAILGARHLSCAVTLNNLAELAAARGRVEGVEVQYREAIAIAANARAPAEQVAYLMNLAGFLASNGQWREAHAVASRSIDLEDEVIAKTLAVASERQRLSYLAMARARLSIRLSIVLGQAPLDDVTIASLVEMVLKRKGIALETSALQQAAVLGTDRPDLRPLLGELAGVRARLAQWELHDGEGEGSVELSEHAVEVRGVAATLTQRDRAVAVLKERCEHLESELSRAMPELHHDSLRCSLVDVTAALPPRSALVELVRVTPVDFSASRVGYGEPLPPRYLAFVVRADGATGARMVDLGDADALDQLVMEFRQGMDEEVSPDDDCDLRLRVAAFDPIRPYLDGVEHILISPDGELSRIPFEALPGDEGLGHLLDTYLVSYLSVGREVMRFIRAPAEVANPPLVVAAPDYDLRDGSTATKPAQETASTLVIEQLRFEALAGTVAEGKDIAAVLGVEPCLGAEALKTRIKNCRSPHILHIATHGFFLEVEPPAQPRDAVGRGTAWLNAPAGDPLLRAGLALAGVNSVIAGFPVPSDVGDGILTAYDVLSIDLHRTELVVLSACETGLGQVMSGEGVFGLRRTFAVAGARSLVMSLWKVPDAETGVFMGLFYRRLLNGVPRAQALRETQLELRGRFEDPFVWAAFICQGDPGPLALRRVARDVVS
jgi:CHAT domain-containing protein/tetratricopeptide (TPR) repeat protein